MDWQRIVPLRRTLLCLLLVATAAPFGPGPVQAKPRAAARERERDRTSHLSRRQRRRLPWGAKRDPRLDVHRTARELSRLARQHPQAMRLRTIGHADGLPLLRVDLDGGARRRSGRGKLRVLVAAGVHGNEPTGVLAAMQLVRRALRGRRSGLLERFALTVLPMVNPGGLAARTRYNRAGHDVNRSFRPGRWTPESRAVARAIAGERFDLFVDLHGSFRDGHFLIRGGDDGALSRRILRALQSNLLLSGPRGADGARAIGPYRLHTLGGVTSDTPGTFKGFMKARGTPLSYTAEYARTLPPKQQLRGLFKLLRSTLNNAHAARR